MFQLFLSSSGHYGTFSGRAGLHFIAAVIPGDKIIMSGSSKITSEVIIKSAYSTLLILGGGESVYILSS